MYFNRELKETKFRSQSTLLNILNNFSKISANISLKFTHQKILDNRIIHQIVSKIIWKKSILVKVIFFF